MSMSVKMIEGLVINVQTLLVDLSVDAMMATITHQLQEPVMVSLKCIKYWYATK